MFPSNFTTIQFFQKKRDITLYHACDPSHRYIIKSIITKDISVKQAFSDEYQTLSSLHHPSIPIYYGISEHFRGPGQTTDALALCMEDCSCPAPTNAYSLSALCEILKQTADILTFLLKHGILYTDLNPSNLIISQKESGAYHVTLIDYTYCYYFLRNPYPSYIPRFSYDLSPQLKGQQFLIQALTYLFYDLIEQNHITELTSPIYQLLETGRNPSSTLSLQDFSQMIQHCFHT